MCQINKRERERDTVKYVRINLFVHDGRMICLNAEARRRRRRVVYDQKINKKIWIDGQDKLWLKNVLHKLQGFWVFGKMKKPHQGDLVNILKLIKYLDYLNLSHDY